MIKRTYHGLTHHPLYQVWNAMIKRCYNPNTVQYKDWEGRGITVCSEWRNNFVSFFNYCIANGWQKGLTIDRIDNNGNYEPNNVRISTYKIQGRNTRKNCFITYNILQKKLINSISYA